ncbi:MAG: hypothetical protein PHQ91_15515 [Thermoanaerobaculaceae bacterium]|nr:hypothetical protein [Thermoanaerobaculaceae bacterium]
MIGAFLLALAATTAPEPTYLVERIVTVGGAETRVSVFRNGVAVLARRRPGEAENVVRQPLSEVEMKVVTQVVEECYPEIARFSGVGDTPGSGRVELRLAPPGKNPLLVRYAVTAAPSLAVARLAQALDGLEARLVATRVTREDLSGWEPAAGDRVELEDGRVVQVLSVTPSLDSVVVHLQVGDGPATFFITEQELRRLAVRRVAK